jgi:hypothetical protein
MALILTEITKKNGYLNQSIIYRIRFIDSETGQVYTTTVDTSYENYTRSGWDKIVNSDNPYGVYKGLKITNKRDRDGDQVINADSRPELTLPLTLGQVKSAIEDLVKEIEAKATNVL